MTPSHVFSQDYAQCFTFVDILFLFTEMYRFGVKFLESIHTLTELTAYNRLIFAQIGSPSTIKMTTECKSIVIFWAGL